MDRCLQLGALPEYKLKGAKIYFLEGDELRPGIPLNDLAIVLRFLASFFG